MKTSVARNVYFQYFPEHRPCELAGGFSGTTVLFETPTAVTAEMLHAISPKLAGLFLPARRYKKAGVVFFGLESGEARQLDLFSSAARDEKGERLAAAMDRINRQFGRGALFHLAEGVEKPWKMKREFLSPGCTTNWNQLPEVK